MLTVIMGRGHLTMPKCPVNTFTFCKRVQSVHCTLTMPCIQIYKQPPADIASGPLPAHHPLPLPLRLVADDRPLNIQYTLSNLNNSSFSRHHIPPSSPLHSKSNVDPNGSATRPIGHIAQPPLVVDFTATSIVAFHILCTLSTDR